MLVSDWVITWNFNAFSGLSLMDVGDSSSTFLISFESGFLYVTRFPSLEDFSDDSETLVAVDGSDHGLLV